MDKLKNKKITHVIFDMDGLLLDTEHIYESIVRDICKVYNRNYPREVRMKVLGTTEQRTAEIAIDELKLPINTNQFKKHYTDLCKLRLVDAPLLKGAERLVRHLHFHNIPMALATSSSEESVEIKTRKHRDLFSLFNVKVMGSSDPEVKLGKPAPDIFLVAAKRFPDNPNPEQCLVFEDAPNGVRAARKAGMQVVMVPDTHVTDQEKSEANFVIPSLESVNLELFGLPSISK